MTPIYIYSTVTMFALGLGTQVHMNNNGQKKTKLNVKAQIPQKEPSNGGRAMIVVAQKLATLCFGIFCLLVMLMYAK